MTTNAPCRNACDPDGFHAFDCPNHPTAVAKPKHCATCTCPNRRTR